MGPRARAWRALALAAVGFGVERSLRGFSSLPAELEPFVLALAKSGALFAPLVAALTLGATASELGLARIGRSRRLETVGLVLVAVGIGVALAQRDDVRSVYPLYAPARTSVGAFLMHTGVFTAYAFAWETFFRGLLLFGARPLLGRASVVAQALVFTLAHVGVGKPLIEIALAFPGGIALGLVAQRGGSCFGPFFAHAALAITVNVACILPRLA